MSPVSREYVKALCSLSYCRKDHANRRQQSNDIPPKHSHPHLHSQQSQESHGVDPPTLTSHGSVSESPASAVEVEAAGGGSAEYTIPIATPTSTKHSADVWPSQKSNQDSCDSFCLEDLHSFDADTLGDLPAFLRLAADSAESSDDLRASISILQQFSCTREILDLFHSST